MIKNGKTLFVELDGATWDIINPLLKQGKLPNIKRLVESGTSGTLQSIVPSISPKIWTSIFAGKHHDKTGIDFFGANSKMVKCKRIWDIWNDNGLKVGIFGSFATWPPYEVNGFMIPAVDSLGTETYPAEYQFFQEIALNERKKSKGIQAGSIPFGGLFHYVNKLRRAGVGIREFVKIANYMAQERIRRFDKKDRYWRKLILHSDISTDVFLHLCRRFDPDFATIHMHICDSVCHRYWMAYEPDKYPDVTKEEVKRYRNVIPEAYMQADKAIGKILTSRNNWTHVVVVSDHGFMGFEGGIDTYDINISKLLEVLGIKDKVIVARFGPGVYLNFQDPDLMHQIADVVAEAHIQKTGEKIFQANVFEKTVIVTKPTWKIDREQAVGKNLPIDFGPFGIHKTQELYTRQESLMSGVHHEDGIIIFSGPGIKAGSSLEHASIYDVAPTLLYLWRFPVARDMDGRVLTEALRKGFLSENPIEYVNSYEECSGKEEPQENVDHEKIAKRLKSLGYL